MIPLMIRAIGGMAFLLGVMALMIFGPAGTLDFWQGWLFLIVFGASVIATSAYLMVRDPALVERRMHGGPTGETRAIQKVVQAITGACFLGILIVGGLDHRYGWSRMPAGLAVFADLVVVVSLAIVFEVLRENSFAAATIQV